jgi:predicted Zn-dependent peptidase
MKDLDTATLADVKGWFHDHYGPNNAVLVLAGDVDVATARPLVEKYFGSIARGPETTAPVAPVTPLTHPIAETISDRVAMVMIDRSWTVPGLNDKDSTALDVAAGVLGGLASSRLDNIMVRQEKLAVSVSASNSSGPDRHLHRPHHGAPRREPGAGDGASGRDHARFPSKGPTQAEVERVKTRQTVDTVETFESLNDKAQALAEGQLFSGDPAVVAKLTPADLRAFHQAWLRPDKAKIFVTSNLPLEQVQAMLDTAFGHWAATGQGGAKTFPANSRPAQPQIVLVDRPDRPSPMCWPPIPTVWIRRRMPSPCRPPIRRWAAISSRASTWTCARKSTGPMACAGGSRRRSMPCPMSSPPRFRPTARAIPSLPCARIWAPS